VAPADAGVALLDLGDLLGREVEGFVGHLIFQFQEPVKLAGHPMLDEDVFVVRLPTKMPSSVR
jgi:hypothetical protein